MKGQLVGVKAHWLVRMIFRTSQGKFQTSCSVYPYNFYIKVCLYIKHVRYFSMSPLLFMLYWLLFLDPLVRMWDRGRGQLLPVASPKGLKERRGHCW